MSNQTQQQIDTLIQIINDAEEPGTVTNLIVAAVLAFLADKVKTMATASALDTEVSALETVDASLDQAIQNEATARQAADTTLSDRISALQVALDRLMSGNVSETIESFNEVINFLNEVTDDETLTGLLSQINNRIASVEDDLAAKADLNRYTNKLAYGHAPDVVLATMGDALDNVNNSGATNHYVPVAGDTYWDSTSRTIKYIDVGGTTRDLDAPKGGLVYCNKRTNLTYRWDATTGWKQVGGGPGGASDIVNNLVSGGIDKALSAEQGKVLRQKIIEVQNNVERLYNALGNAAFWSAQSKADGAPVELDWSTSKNTVTLNCSLVTAEQAVIKDGNNNILGSSFLVEEGADFTLKVEGINGWSLSNIHVSGATPKSSSGSTFVFSMGTSNMSITISGTAVKAATVTKTLTGCSVVQNSESSASPTIGGFYSVQIEPSEGNSFSSFSVTMEDDTNPSKITVTEANGVKTISISEVTGDILIVAVAAGLLIHGYKINHGEGYPQEIQDANYCYTRLIPVSNGDELLIDNGFVLSSIASVIVYDNTAVDGDVSTGFLGYLTANNRARTYLVNDEGAAFIRIVMKESELDKIASYNGTQQSYIYKGSNSPILAGMKVRRALQTSGAEETPNNGNYCITPYIEVPANVTKLQAFKGLSGWGSSFVGCYYDSNKTKIGVFGNNADPFVSSIPANTAFIRFTMVAVGHWADSYVFAYDEDNGNVINGTYLWRGPGLPYAPNDPDNPSNQSE